ncbi:MAG TPA: hypothetical protein VD768_04495 [Sphingomicrobium sp.]|nr:hypothetical protein [Sphingomicrobium sp.]
MAKTATKGAKKKSSSKAVATATGGGNGSDNRSADDSNNSAADALLKLLESPLVADLLAVGATAALAALAEHRYSSRSGESAGAKRALKGAVTAAAAAMGRRIATEFDEIKKASKAKSAEAA